MQEKNMSPTRTTLSKAAAMVIAVLSLSAVTGCHNNKGPAVDPNSLGPTNTAPAAVAPTASITADPLAIDLGQSVVLNWRTQNAAVVTIDGIGQVNLNGTQTVSPSNSTNFHLSAKGDGGTIEANVRVTVRVPVAPTVPPPTGNIPSDMGTDEAFHQNVQDAFFDYDSADLRPDAQAAIAQAASYLAAHPAIRVVIGGYCDDRGSAEYNLALGESRANAARTALVSAGVAPTRLRVISYGKEKQFCTEDTESCWQENRRAQFSIDR
jgi:peptidoglycan-associated lipoprotein